FQGQGPRDLSIPPGSGWRRREECVAAGGEARGIPLATETVGGPGIYTSFFRRNRPRSGRNQVVMRRCPTLPALVAVAVALAAWSVPVRADGIASANYTLKIPGGLPNPGSDVEHVTSGVSLPQLEATVVPAGGILPPTQSDGTQGSPLTILPDSF